MGIARCPEFNKNGMGNAGFNKLWVEIVSFSGCLLIKDSVTGII